MSKYQVKYTDEIIQFIRDNCREFTDKYIAEMINEQWGISVTQSSVKNAKMRYGIKSGVLRGTFVKGQPSWNKGKKVGTKGRMAETQFKKGQTPINHRPVGSERVNVYGYVEIKVAEPNKWNLKHRIIWEKHHGKIPDGHTIILLDGDKQNVELSNLTMISRSQLAILNKNKMLTNDAEINKSSTILADLIHRISSRKRAAKK